MLAARFNRHGLLLLLIGKLFRGLNDMNKTGTFARCFHPILSQRQGDVSEQIRFYKPNKNSRRQAAENVVFYRGRKKRERIIVPFRE
jgi:hypothetical protein